MTPDTDGTPELTEARRRLAELEAAEAERRRAEKVQAVLYRIAELASAAQDMQEFYRAIHAVVGELMHANNFFIALYDEERQLINWPYFVDELDLDVPDPKQWDAFGEGNARGNTAYVLRTGEPQLLDYGKVMQLVERGEIELVGVWVEDTSWIGVPLKADGRTVGVLVVQSYTKSVQYSEEDMDLLAFVAQHIGVALSRARAIEETRQRNAELALINSVQEALAGELELQAIYDVVGDKLQEVFDAQVVDIGIYDEAAGLVHFPYTIERGVRFPDEPIELIGFRKHVMETRQPLMLEHSTPEVAEHYGNPFVLTGEPTRSALFVPLVVGARATGVISLQNLDRTHAFSEADQRLLTTLAGSLSVALENARLVHETRQRNAELALINSVQDALAGELELQAIYDVVGDKIQEIFDAQVVDIAIFDFEAGLTHYPYTIERGVRFPDEPVPMMASPITRHMFETKAPILINDVPAWDRERGETSPVFQGEPALSALIAPLVSGDELRGRISLQNLDRTNAFSDNDVRLLATLAGSLSVALENARLVHETRQRNAELAVINDVQAAIAGELDPQAIYDLVGDKLQEVFDAQVVSISMHDQATGLLDFPYVIERGERMQVDPIPLLGFRKHVLETREPLMINEDVPAAAKRYGNPLVLSGEPVKSSVFVPLLAGGNAVGVVSLQNLDRENAFTESDLSVLTTVSGSVSVALENARLVEETRQRVAELATVNRVGQALASQLELDALIELVGARVRETFEADIAYVALHDEPAGRIDFPYYYEAGERRGQDAMQYGEGLTSQIVDSREPLLLNRVEHYEGRPTVGTPSRSYLGVPILVGDNAIGVVSVQSTREEGRFAEPDARLLATIASNVGVAIQNARLFAEIRRQKQYFESLGEISPVAVVVMDPDERVTGWNPAAMELFGHTAQEALGRQIDDLVFGDDVHDEGREITREALTGGRAQRIARRRRKDGTPIDVEVMLVPLTVDDERLGFLAIYHDITELQRAREEAEAATQAKSAFLATMSHEIRTPMNAVIGMTDLLLGTELTGEQRDFAQIVRSSGDALLHVIDDILDYSKIEAGKLELEREPFDLRECVEGALDLVAPRGWEKEIELGCLIDEDAPAGILGDNARLRQVLLNLLSNAVKFTEQGEVVVLVDAQETASGSYQLELAVRDTGIGIPPERMDRLFTSFSQVDASTTRRYGGTGLGLAISKRLVDLMGGTISVESEEGKGSTFRIALTVEAAQVPARISLDDALPRLAGKGILIVDDNATNREIVTRHARSWGMEPVAVELPSAALELIEGGGRFDVAVLDMMMPDMDGIALAREIRRHRAERDLPLLLLTSLGRLPQARSTGEFSAQLAKPIKASQLYNALVQLLVAGADEDEAVHVAIEGNTASRSLRILLAEDNAMNQMVALHLLERLGYGADVASNGLEALEALERKRYDVVLMDVQMPELDGLDASRRICERWPADTRPRIIAMTANAMPEDREACLAAGMNDYVAKPIRADELAKALKRARPLRTKADPGSDAAEVTLNAGALENLRELGGDDFLSEVIDAFLADSPTLLSTLRQALDDNGADELRRAAHTLKSNGSTLGAEEFATLCRELEQRAKSGRLEGASELVSRIEQDYELLRKALGALRSPAAT
jgi:PAS domain S-box-containing protein